VPATVSSQYLIRVSETDGNPTDTSNAPFSTAALTVTSPNGGETWDAGKTRQITWEAEGITKPLKISLWKDGVKVGNMAVINDLNARSYAWTVGDYFGGTAAPGTGYTIKIKEQDTPVSDESDGSFEIAKFFGLTSPDGGETWLLGTTRDITWKVPRSFSGQLRIMLLKNSKSVEIATINNPTSGSYSWIVGKYKGGIANEGTGYKIKIEAVGTTISDESDAPFELKKFNGLLSPNGGENLLIGTTWNITWNLPYSYSGNITLVLMRGSKEIDIATITDPTARSYSWKVGEYIGGIAPAGTGYKIKIKYGSVSDVSDTAFDLSD
jgi:hypothetical protein